MRGLDDIMAISGHKTEQNFLRYIKVTREQRAKRRNHPLFSMAIVHPGRNDNGTCDF